MGYTALYRKFRPMRFDEIVGQEHIVKTLKNQIIADRIGHAYLFNGGRGTGKTSAAKVLARAVNCLNPKDGEPCNECEICKAALDGSLTDIVEMDAASNNSVEDVSKYHLGGLVLFGESFKNKTREDILKMIEELQSRADYPLFLAVDEEGGSVVRVSSNRNLKVKSFSSPRSLYIEGGFELIRRDNEEKNELLKSLGLNINLAPVLDISTDKSDYIYYRSIGLSPELTGEFAKVIIESSKDSGIVNVMKHYPGYGKNKDTHKTSSLDTRSMEEIERDLDPFKRAILSGAEAIMISHNTVAVLDSINPASISINNHNYLRNTLDFRGMVITDALNMGATADIEDIGLKAILAGNNIIITKNYAKNIEEIINYVKAGNLSEEYLKALAVKVIAWKIKMGLIK